MIRVIIERKAKPGKERELEGLLLDLRVGGMREPGYVSGETLAGQDDPTLYVVLSTWRSLAHWQVWASSAERQKMDAKVERILSAPTKITVLRFLEEH